MTNDYCVFAVHDIQHYPAKPHLAHGRVTQIGRGKFAGSVESLRCSGMFVARYSGSQTLYEVGRLEPGVTALLLFDPEDSVYAKEHYYGRGGFLCLEGGQVLEAVARGGGRHVAVFFRDDAILRLFSAAHIDLIRAIARAENEISLAAADARQAALGAFDEIFTALNKKSIDTADNKAMAALQERVAAQFARVLDTVQFEELRANASGRLVDRVLDYIAGAKRERLKVSDLARGLHTSPRTIELAFKTYLGVTPKEYLVNTSLNRARRDLLNLEGESSIKDVARRHGFSHMGNFSRAYFKLFQERPSDTLRLLAASQAG